MKRRRESWKRSIVVREEDRNLEVDGRGESGKGEGRCDEEYTCGIIITLTHFLLTPYRLFILLILKVPLTLTSIISGFSLKLHIK